MTSSRSGQNPAAFNSSPVRSVGPAGLPGSICSCSADRLRRYLGSLHARTISTSDIGRRTDVSCATFVMTSMKTSFKLRLTDSSPPRRTTADMRLVYFVQPHRVQLLKVSSVQVSAVVKISSRSGQNPAAFNSSPVRSVGPAGLPGSICSCSTDKLRRYLGSLHARTISTSDIGRRTDVSCATFVMTSMKTPFVRVEAGSQRPPQEEAKSSKMLKIF